MNNLINPSRHYRTLIRIEAYDIESGIIKVIIPGWNPHQIVEFPIKDIPEMVINRIKDDYVHFHCQVNLSAKIASDLNPINWENV